MLRPCPTPRSKGIVVAKAATDMARCATNLRPKGRGRKLVGQGEVCIERICGASFRDYQTYCYDMV